MSRAEGYESLHFQCSPSNQHNPERKTHAFKTASQAGGRRHICNPSTWKAKAEESSAKLRQAGVA